MPDNMLSNLLSFTDGARYMMQNYLDVVSYLKGLFTTLDIIQKIDLITYVLVYTTEFQKRGLFHSHICLLMHADSKRSTVEYIDPIISAEIPNEDPKLYSHVSEFMIHDPRGAENMNFCMINKGPYRATVVVVQGNNDSDYDNVHHDEYLDMIAHYWHPFVIRLHFHLYDQQVIYATNDDIDNIL
uniref:Helitron helicase-like domain-containing protein n=1 Tax=Lactuca sativa TaxID=4236 RepID=A0A9R1XI06_LACSA|nr:hypothetical protein LSAT_V11C400193920 [Lactuca sativa]